MSLTVVYYTSNREHPHFEARIQRRLRHVAGHLPIISVSQKPVRLGKNICVGDVGASDANAMRQLLLGAKQATTEFIATAEADFVYPPTYFSFEPANARECYRYSNVWILFHRGGFRRKEFSEGAQIVGRTYLIEKLEAALDGRLDFTDPRDGWRGSQVFKKRTWQTWGHDFPAISCKTGRGLRSATGTVRKRMPEDSLPYWGTAEGMREELFR